MSSSIPKRIDSVKLESRKTLYFVQFVDEERDRPTFFDSYYVVPADDLAEEADVVLRDALKAAKKVGVGQFVMRGEERRRAEAMRSAGLLLETLRYADGRLQIVGLLPRHWVTRTRSRPARHGFDAKSSAKPASSIRTSFTDRLRRRSPSPDRGESRRPRVRRSSTDPDVDAPPPKGSNVIDLMAALKKSLGDEKRGKAGRPPAGRPQPKKEPAAKAPARKKGRSSCRPRSRSYIETYNRKRYFAKTKEPRGRKLKGKGDSFVVQNTTRRDSHWDFRLELDGVLKSGRAQGPKPRPWRYRPPMRTEDHPLDYGGFEGTIPKGEYGGGTVTLWDQGRWIPDPCKRPEQDHRGGALSTSPSMATG